MPCCRSPRVRRAALGPLLALLSGCAAYHAKPLRAPALATLRGPTHQALVRAARALRVPGVAPLRLNFRSPLSGKELGVIAVIANPALRALRARERIAHAQVFAAGLLPDPVISFSALKPYGIGAAGHTTALSDGFLWDLSRLVTRSTDIRMAREHASAVRYQVAWREWVAANATRLAARRVYWLKAEWRIVRRAQALWQGHEAHLASDLRRHLIARRQWLFFQAAEDGLRLKAAAVHRALEAARLALAGQLGLAPTVPLALAPPRRLRPVRGAPAALFHRAVARRLDLVALVAAYRSADAALLRAVLDQYPRLSLGAAGARNSSGVSEAGLQLALVLPLFNANRGAVAIARARRRALFAAYVARLAAARTQIYRLDAAQASLNRELADLKGRRRTLSRTARSAQAAFKAHALSLVSYLTWMQELTTVELNMTALHLARAATTLALITATARPWSGGRA
ncbi:TolC family protein [Acidiferrobacter sp.]|uniref:TolC family protein n=1 Tax=Acidiferrobacter sp. TaxID=1872107 RepID=UPI00262F99F0|nr:TolC family protein [Acidiferrobacter sp.]